MDLLRIQLDSQALDQLGSVGIKTKKRLQGVVEDLGITAVRAFQSKVPVDTGELRNQHIDLRISGKGRDTEAVIYVDTSPHYGRRRKPMSASALAELLQNTGYKRSRGSEAFPPYSSVSGTTAGWIDKGRQAFKSSYRTYLRNLTK